MQKMQFFTARKMYKKQTIRHCLNAFLTVNRKLCKNVSIWPVLASVHKHHVD